MIAIGSIDPNKTITAAAIVRMMYANLKAGKTSRLLYARGFHYVLPHPPAELPDAVEINRIDGCAWDNENWATLFNDVTWALQEFHSRRAGEAAKDMSLVA